MNLRARHTGAPKNDLQPKHYKSIVMEVSCNNYVLNKLQKAQERISNLIYSLSFETSMAVHNIKKDNIAGYDASINMARKELSMVGEIESIAPQQLHRECQEEYYWKNNVSQNLHTKEYIDQLDAILKSVREKKDSLN